MTSKMGEGYKWVLRLSVGREKRQTVQEEWVADTGSLSGGNIDFGGWPTNNPSSGIFLPVRLDARP
jgi:hypothetical protein